MNFKPFDYNNPPDDDLYWVAFCHPDYDIDTDDCGGITGTPTGKTVVSTALVWLSVLPHGKIHFDAVDSVNHGSVSEDGHVTHFAEVKPPELPAVK